MRRHVYAKRRVFADQRRRRLARRTVGNILRLVGEALGVGGEIQIIHHQLFLLRRQARGDNPAVQLKDLPVPEHFHRLLFLFNDREQSAVVGAAHDDFFFGEAVGRVRAGAPPDNVVFDGVKFGERAVNAGGRAQHIINFVRRDAVGEQSPFHIVDGALFQRAFARKVFGVKNIPDARRLATVPFRHIGAITESRGINNLRDKARRHQRGAEILCRRRAVGGGREDFVKVNLNRQTLVAGANGVGGDDINQIPGDIARFVLRAQLGDGFVGRIVVDDFHAGVLLHIRLVISVLLAGGIGAAPRDDGQVFLGGESGARENKRARGGAGEDAFNGFFHFGFLLI